MAISPPGLGTLWGVSKDIGGWLRRRLHMLSPEERLAKREQWKERFREEIWETAEKELRQDVIVRDVRRLDEYPNSSDDRKISSWFRVGLVGQYHRGIELGLGVHSLTFDEREEPKGAWRLSDYQNDTETIKAFLVGYVRYDDIEAVDWYGDEYYGYPHIYCHFSHHGQPYERLAFCEQRSVIPKHFFYSEIASYDEVKLTSFKFGTAHHLWRSG